MSVTDKTAEQTFDSLTGFDEIAIRSRFGESIGSLASSENRQETTFLRALAFVQERRNGSSDAAAYTAAMEYPIGLLTEGDGSGYFAPDVDELDPTDPDTVQGKAEGQMP